MMILKTELRSVRSAGADRPCYKVSDVTFALQIKKYQEIATLLSSRYNGIHLFLDDTILDLPAKLNYRSKLFS